MFISPAHATGETPTATTAETAVPAGDAAFTPPSTSNIILQNVGMIVLLVVMFYFLLIRPQQKRFKEHKEMLDGLKEGDKIVTSGGLLGRVDKIVSNEEVIVDLGNGIKVSHVRGMIQGKADKPAAATK